MNCEYVQKYYNVPACIGRKISYKGRNGIIAEDRGNYIGVTFDDEYPGIINNFHPEEEGLSYLDMGKVRKITRSQDRYKRYLKNSDSFTDFHEFLLWESYHKRKSDLYIQEM